MSVEFCLPTLIPSLTDPVGMTLLINSGNGKPTPNPQVGVEFPLFFLYVFSIYFEIFYSKRRGDPLKVLVFPRNGWGCP